MSKELEALRNFISECENDWKTQPKRWVDGAINSNVSKYMDSLKSILTPPTADEVCKALSGWFDEKFYYDVNQKEFYTKALNGQHSVVKLKKNEIHFGGWYTMPPHLITLIGRFYEAQE